MWKKFKEQLPFLGSNVIFRNETHVSIAVFDFEFRRSIKYVIENNASDGNSESYCVYWFSDDPEKDGCWCVDDAKEWMYVSELLEGK